MCGRYTQLLPWDELVRLYRLTETGMAPNLPPRWNAAPTQTLPVVVQEDERRRLALARWGLVPAWAKELKGPALINARSETAATSPAFRAAFRARRCLVPSDGFYEWTGEARARQPWRICLDGRPLTFAGLWERNERLGLVSFAILTTPSTGALAGLHDRMPAILEPGMFDAWLAPAASIDALAPLLSPYRGGDLMAFPVSPRVNGVKADDAALIEPLPAPSQLALFEPDRDRRD